MANRIGSGYHGSPSIQSSTANQEIVDQGKIYYKFSLFNMDDMVVKINGGDNILLQAGQSFNSDSTDAPIHSFIIVTQNASYNWIGAF